MSEFFHASFMHTIRSAGCIGGRPYIAGLSRRAQSASLSATQDMRAARSSLVLASNSRYAEICFRTELYSNRRILLRTGRIESAYPIFLRFLVCCQCDVHLMAHTALFVLDNPVSFATPSSTVCESIESKWQARRLADKSVPLTFVVRWLGADVWQNLLAAALRPLPWSRVNQPPLLLNNRSCIQPSLVATSTALSPGEPVTSC